MNKETTTKPEIITTNQRQFEKDTQKHQNFLQFCFGLMGYLTYIPKLDPRVTTK